MYSITAVADTVKPLRSGNKNKLRGKGVKIDSRSNRKVHYVVSKTNKGVKRYSEMKTV